MLTTVDNPYDPRYEYSKWLKYDHDQGYYTQELLGRVAPMVLNEEDNPAIAEAMTKEAQQQIINSDLLGIYKIVEEDDKPELPDS